MAQTHPDEHVLNVPAAEPVQYERNLIRQAVCELRFPILLELETEQPVALQRALRKDYPHYEAKLDLEIKPGAATSQRRHVFWSKKRTWAVALKPFAITVEAVVYSNFEELLSRLEKVLQAARPIIDSDFFTRVGLRYVNVIPAAQGEIDGWVNADLIRPLANGVYGTANLYWQEIRGRTNHGGYLFRHGYAPTEGASPKEYALDFDMYRESVEADQVSKVLSDLHADQFRFFSWSIGDKAKQYMGKASKKGRL